MLRIPHRVACCILALGAVAGFTACTSPTRPDSATLETAFQERCTLLVNEVADNYVPTVYADRGKYSFPKIIARMEKYGLEDSEAVDYLLEYTDGEYGFFHFPFVGIARIMAMYPDAPVVKEHKKAFLERILLHDPEYHYNALTGEGTENHVSMSRTNGYLFAQMALGDEELDEVAREWQAALKEWFMDWSKRIYAYGTGEWDSSPYTAYNLVGWLNLYDFADDPEIRQAARAVLDYYATNMALKYTQGLQGGPESRGYSTYEPLSRSATEYMAWLWFGPRSLADNEGFFNGGEFIQSLHVATSGYRPPEELHELALKEIPKPAVYVNTKPNYLLTKKAESLEVFRIDQSFTLGTVQTPYGGWLNSAYGVINWKLIIENNDGLPAIVMGNGGMKSLTSARGRNPFDQFLQHGKVVVQMTRVPENAGQIEQQVGEIFEEWRTESQRDFQARWGRPHQFEDTFIDNNGRGELENANKSIIHLPTELDYALVNNWAFTRYADTYLSFRSLSGSPPVLKPGRLIDEAPAGEVAGFIMEVANSADHESFEAFISKVIKQNISIDEEPGSLVFHYKSLENEALEFSYSTSGSWKEMIYDWGSGVVEKRIGFNTTDWQQPDWPSGEGHGRIPVLKVDGTVWPAEKLDAILSGPQLQLDGSVLTIEDAAGNQYRVDYSSELPKFTSIRD